MSEQERLALVAKMLTYMAQRARGYTGRCPCGEQCGSDASVCPSCLRLAASALARAGEGEQA